MVTDFLGIELKVGDTVIDVLHINADSKKKSFKKIKRFTTKMVVIEYQSGKQKHVYAKYLISVQPYFKHYPELFL